MASRGAALLVHGAGGGGWEWAIWRGVFTAHGFDVHAPDLHPAPDGLAATTFEDYLAQVRVALDAMPRPRTLVGASLGGLLAMACAEAADALVLGPVNAIQAGRVAPQWPPGGVARRSALLLARSRRAAPPGGH